MSPYIVESVIGVRSRLDRDDRLAHTPESLYEEPDQCGPFHHHPEINEFLRRDHEFRTAQRLKKSLERAERGRRLIRAVFLHTYLYFEILVVRPVLVFLASRTARR